MALEEQQEKISQRKSDQERPSIFQSIKDIGDHINSYFADLFNIHRGLDWIGTVTSIRSKVDLQGENAWMLVCSVIIASVGLNMNSSAVIIGAMLISPLMSQILGIGLGIGINDRALLEKSVRNFAVAILFALLISFLYFRFLTPLKDAGSEIISRTQPTILDALVAIFGGVAGIVAVSRKEKGAAIPGVAIATALVPPLAVSGYGLANGIWHYFTNAFYLFFLNAMLIAFSTTAIVRYLGFPMKEFQSDEGRKKATLGIVIFIILLLIPGTIILRKLLIERDRSKKIEHFFHINFDEGENQMYGQAVLDTYPSKDTLQYKVSYRGVQFDSTNMASLQKELSQIQGKPTLIDATLLNLSKDQINKLNAKSQQLDQKEVLYQNEMVAMQKRIDSLSKPNALFKELDKDVAALWPDIQEISFAESYTRNYSDSVSDFVPVVLVTWNKIPRREKEEQGEQLKRYLSSQEMLKNVEIIHRN